MKKILLSLYLIATVFPTLAQNKTSTPKDVEKSIFGIELGLLHLIGYNEFRIAKYVALRSELGFVMGFGSSSNENYTVIGTTISLEPRWYYNLKRRVAKNKRIDGNSGNFFSLLINFHPNLILYNSNKNVNIVADFSITPSYGIRRSFGKHFTYEFDFGIGYLHYINPKNYTIANKRDVSLNINAKIGYRF